MNIRTLDEVPLKTALQVWNEGFEGYYVNLQMNYSAFLGRLHQEDLSAEESIVLYDGERPIGLTLNGVRMVAGQKVAWNGGTAIVSSCRGRGMGRLLLEENIRRYQEVGADLALLEAFVQNTPAIKLYEQFGYEGYGTSLFYEIDEASLITARETVPGVDACGLTIREVEIAAAAGLPIYDHSGPWQTNWQSLKGGRCLIAGQNGVDIAYLPFRSHYSPAGKLVNVVLYPGKVAAGAPSAEAIIELMISRILENCREGGSARAIHIPAADTLFRGGLVNAGFRQTHELLLMNLAI